MHNFKEWFIINETKEEKALALELAGNAGILTDLSKVIPQGKKDTDKLLLLAAYYYSKNKNLEEIKTEMSAYIGYVVENKMELITVDLLSKQPVSPWNSYVYWTQIIHGKQGNDAFKKKANFEPTENDFQGEVPFLTSPDGKIKVYKGNSPQQCIILGRGESFCISKPGNTNWQGFRDERVSTFYFVYDSTRNDRLSIVVIDQQDHETELTDKVNNTGVTLDPYTGEKTEDSESYMRYLKEKGIDTSKIVNIPRSPEEEEERQKLGSNNANLDWFASLSFEDKSKYIGRGHKLSDEQFDYLLSHKLDTLLIQYVRTGLKLNDYQINKIATIRDLRDKYIHNRLIRVDEFSLLKKNEYYLLNPAQKEKYYEKMNDESKLKLAVKYGDLNMVRFVIDRKNIIEIFNFIKGSLVDEAAKNGSLNVLIYFIEEKGIKPRPTLIKTSIESGHLDIVKYLLGDEVVDKEGNVYKLKNNTLTYNIGKHAVSNAAESGNSDLVKYLVQKGGEIGTDAVTYAAKSGNLDLVEYLVEKGGKVDGSAVTYAAETDNFNLIKYLVEKGGEIDPVHAIPRAIERGILHIIKYLVEKLEEQGGEIFDHQVNTAASLGRLDIVKYLVEEKGLKMNPEFALNNAVQGGNLDLIRYIVEEKGGEISDHAVYWALVERYNNIVRYLLGDEVVDEKGNVCKLPRGKRIGVINDEAFEIAVQGNNLDFIKYLLSKGAKITDRIINNRFSQTVKPDVFNYLYDVYFSNKK
jgi:ankyrin repeat protein